MQLSVSEQQEGSQRLQQEMRRLLQEKEQTIRAQREQVGTRSRPQPDYAEKRKWGGGSALIQDILDLLHALRLCVCADIMIL